MTYKTPKLGTQHYFSVATMKTQQTKLHALVSFIKRSWSQRIQRQSNNKSFLGRKTRSRCPTVPALLCTCIGCTLQYIHYIKCICPHQNIHSCAPFFHCQPGLYYCIGRYLLTVSLYMLEHIPLTSSYLCLFLATFPKMISVLATVESDQEGGPGTEDNGAEQIGELSAVTSGDGT